MILDADASDLSRHDMPSRSNTPLFEGLVCETHHAAAMSAIVASCINGAVGRRHCLSRDAIDRFLPPEPAVLLALTRRSLLDVEPLSDTRHVLDAFFLALRVLRRKLGAHFFDAAEIGPDRALMIHGRALKDAAAAVCHEGLRAVRALELETPGRLSDLYCEHARALGVMLLAAERGETPCLTAGGEPMLPVLPQRRRSTRRSLGQQCRIVYRNASLSAFVKDVSTGGMGLLRVPFLHADEMVTVELASGRRFTGLVAWCRGEAAGVRFHEPLADSDPLLAI
jgi:hypothetical protein